MGPFSGAPEDVIFRDALYKRDGHKRDYIPVYDIHIGPNKRQQIPQGREKARRKSSAKGAICFAPVHAGPAEAPLRYLAFAYKANVD